MDTPTPPQAADVDVPWDEIDPGIRRVVASAVSAGFKTIASCQGHGVGDAWIVIEIPAYQLDPWQLVSRVEAWVFGNGWDAACRIDVSRVVTRELNTMRWIKVSWWGGVPFR